MRSFLSLASAVLLVFALQTALAQAAPPRRANPGRRNVRSLTWKTHHGTRVTVGARFRGHGHAAPIRRTPAVRSVVKHPTPAHVKTHVTLPHRQHAFGRTIIGRRQTAGARVVIPAVTTTVLVHQPSEEVVVATPELPEADDAETWHVESIIDGTRLVVRREGQIQQLRLLGVAVPAVEQAACGKHLESLAAGQEVRLAFDDALAPQDAEGITTAYVYLAEAGTLLNLQMILDGRGLAEGGYEHTYTELFVAAQAEARAAAHGIWANIGPPVE